MAFNIWERWPWTSFQNLNLDWLMKAVKEAVTKAEEASESVGQFDDRITANENAIDQLEDNLDTISSPVRVYVNSDLEAYYRGQHITGVELKAMLQTHGDLPYVEFNGEVYMLDTVSNAGDLRFSMGHTSGAMDDDLVIRHIMITAQSSNCAYSISNIGSGGGGSSGNVFAVVVRAQSGGYVADHSYAEILSQMQNGRIPVLLVSQGSNTHFSVCGMAGTDTRTINGQSVPCIRFASPGWLYSTSNNVGVWTIDENGVDYMASLKQMATLDNIIQFVNDGVTTNALLKTAQTLTAAEQAQVKQNLNITDGGSTPRTVIAADSLNIPPLSPNTLYVFTGDAAALDITLAGPASNVANEYHFIFNSGAAATTLTVPSDIRWPDGFTVEANHVYEVSILENNMTAQGWAVSA